MKGDKAKSNDQAKREVELAALMPVVAVTVAMAVLVVLLLVVVGLAVAAAAAAVAVARRYKSQNGPQASAQVLDRLEDASAKERIPRLPYGPRDPNSSKPVLFKDFGTQCRHYS